MEVSREMSKRLAGITVLSVISSVNFRDEEYLEPRKILESEGVVVKVASTTVQEARGMLGLKVKPDMSLTEVKVGDFNAVIVAGGSGTPQHLWGNSLLHYILKETLKQSKVVGAICLASAILAEAGLLKGLKATVYPAPEAISKLRAGGAKYIDEPVVVEERIITGRDPNAAVEFGKAIAQAIWKEVLKKPVAGW